jgi:hypothetical protein
MAHRKKDLWLKVFCPEEACLTEAERFHAPEARNTDAEADRWLEVFCPEDSCEIGEATRLP